VATRAGAHGFNGGKTGTALLDPGNHDIRIDYIQVPLSAASIPSPVKCQGTAGQKVLPLLPSLHPPIGVIPHGSLLNSIALP